MTQVPFWNDAGELRARDAVYRSVRRRAMDHMRYEQGE